MKYAPDHFGKHGFHPVRRAAATKWVNVGDLDGIRQNLSREKDTSKGQVAKIDLSKMGFNKLLGGGKVTGAYKVVVASATETAKAKVKANGGEVAEG